MERSGTDEIVDTNVFVRYLTQDDLAKSAASCALFQKVRDKQEELLTSEAIIGEVAYVLSARGGYNLARPVLKLSGLKLTYKRTCLRALEIYVAHPRLDFEDALAAAHMERIGVSRIVSYDRDFDRLPGIQRDEP